MASSVNFETPSASRRMNGRVVAGVLLLLLAGEATAQANCGGYVVVVGGARFRQPHSQQGLRSVDAPRHGTMPARRSSRTPCAAGECQGRTQTPYEPPPVVLVHFHSVGDAAPTMRLTVAAFHWIERCPSDEIFKPPR